MTISDDIEVRARALIGELRAAGKMVAAAESCTGGWIAKSLTDIPGSSACFAYGIVSYSNGAKESLLGVASRTLEEFGAVSEQTVSEMAGGVLNLSGADVAVAVSGVAGPDGGSEEKPVGTVCFGWAIRNSSGIRIETDRQRFEGGRDNVRSQTVMYALAGIQERLGT